MKKKYLSLGLVASLIFSGGSAFASTWTTVNENLYPSEELIFLTSSDTTEYQNETTIIVNIDTDANTFTVVNDGGLDLTRGSATPSGWLSTDGYANVHQFKSVDKQALTIESYETNPGSVALRVINMDENNKIQYSTSKLSAGYSWKTSGNLDGTIWGGVNYKVTGQATKSGDYSFKFKW